MAISITDLKTIKLGTEDVTIYLGNEQIYPNGGGVDCHKDIQNLNMWRIQSLFQM